MYGYLNALFETGYTNPIDRAIIECKQIVDNHDNDVSSKFIKLDEIPYDFIRKRLSVLVSLKANDSYKKTNQIPYKNKDILITKGALRSILEVSSFVETTEGKIHTITTIFDTTHYTLTLPCKWILPYFIASLIIVISTCSAILLSLDTSSL